MVKHTELDDDIVRRNWQSAEAWLNRQNVCCGKLEVVNCGDTDKHKHLMCGNTSRLLANSFIKEHCMRDFAECPVVERLKNTSN